MGKSLRPKGGSLLWEEAAGGRAAAAAATFSLAPKKRYRAGNFGRRSPSPGKCRWRPFASQVRPSQAPRKPGTSDARASGPARAAQCAERAGRAGQPSQRGVGIPVAGVRERAPRLTVQDKLKQYK